MIKEKKVLTEEEIKELKELKSNFEIMVYSLGTIEAEIIALEDTKNEIKSKLIEITNEQKDLAQKLEEKYGPGKLSLETGEIEPF
tara:strand:- start:2047 stop:2301 length:255 start_codon:yes stop_codon:yes gene_type:complete